VTTRTLHAVARLGALCLLALACETSTGPDRLVDTPAFLSVEPVSPTAMMLRWSRVPRAGYEIERRANLQGEFTRIAIIAFENATGGDTVTYYDRDLEPGTFYGYRVRGVGALGSASEPSEISGARTAPAPGVDVLVTTNNISSEGVYTVRAVGPRGEFSQPVPFTGRASIQPMPRGQYEVSLDGLALGCIVSGSVPRGVEVTDEGVETRATVSFVVNCKDPTKGEIHADVLTLGNVAQMDSYLLRLTGLVGGVPVSDTIAVTPRLPGPSTGRFVNLEPGSYDVSIERVDGSVCVIESEPVVEGVQVEAFQVDTVAFTLFCDEVVEGHPLDGVWLQNGSPVSTVAPGEDVTLRIVASIPDTSDLSTFQGQLTWDPTLITAVSARDYDAGPDDIVDQFTANIEAGKVRFINLSVTPDSAQGLQGLIEVDFATQREGLVIAPLQVVVAEDQFATPVQLAPRIPRLSIQLGSGTVPPIARPAGPYQADVGEQVLFDGTTSSDPDGGAIERFIWRFGDGVTDSISGPMASHAYGSAGSYSVTLEVVDDEGERGSASAAVSVADTVSGGGPQAPQGNVLGIWTDASNNWIASASVNQNVFLQICTTRPDVANYQGRLTDIPATVASVSGPVTDLVSTANGAGPCASVGTDIMNQFTFNPSSPTFEHVNVTIASAPGSGPQGLARIPFTIAGAGTLQPTLTVPVLDAFGFQSITPQVGIQALTIGGGSPAPTPPSAQAGGPYAGVVGEAVVMDGSASNPGGAGSIAKYVWTFGDGSPADSMSGARPSHTYTAAGTYEVVLIVRDSGAGVASDTTLALVQSPVGTDFLWSNAFSVSRTVAGDSVALALRTRPGRPFRSVDARVAWGGGSLLLTRIVGGPAFDFVFQADLLGQDSMRIAGTATGELSGTAETTVATLFFRASGSTGDTIVTRTGSVSIRDASLRPISTTGFAKVEDTLAIQRPNLRPVAQAGGPYSARVGDLVGFSAAGSHDPDGSITSFTWNFGDSSTGTGPAPQHAYTAVDTFPVILTVTDNDGGVTADTAWAFVRLTDSPLARANGPYGGQAGTSFAFTAAGSQDPDGSIVSFAWDFGDGATATGPAPQHTYQTIGSFPVQLTVTDNAGASVSTMTSALVWEPPTFALRGTWTVPTAPLSGPAAAPTLQGRGGTAGPGDRVVLRLSSRLGQAFTGASGTIHTDPTVVRYDSIRAGAFFDASFQVSIGGAGSVTIDGASSAPAADPSLEVVLAELFFTVLGLDGSSTTTSTVNLELRDPSNTPIDLTPFALIEGVFVTNEDAYEPANLSPSASTGGPYSGSTGTGIAFQGSASDTDGQVVRYDWDFDDGTRASNAGRTPAHVYSVAGQYSVRLTVVDNDGAIDSDVTTVTITGVTTNAPPVAVAGGPYLGAAGVPFTFDGSASSDSDGSISGYSWSFGDGGTSTGVGPSHTYLTGGAFTVTLTVTDDDGATHSASTTATVTPPNQPPSAAITGPASGETGDSLAFSAAGSGDLDGSIQDYAWDFGNGVTALGIGPTVSYASAGTYTIVLTVTDDDGAADTATVTVAISDPAGPGANVVGVWTDGFGNVLTTATPGQTVYLQVCTTRGDLSAYQSALSGYPGSLGSVDVTDLNSVVDGVGPCANSPGTDILNQYTGNPQSSGTIFSVVNVTISSVPGLGPQGVARYRFASVQAGTLSPTLAVSVLDGFDFSPIAPVVDVPTLTVN
jgi:PKD repeat protein